MLPMSARLVFLRQIIFSAVLLAALQPGAAAGFSGTPPFDRTDAPLHSTCADCHVSSGDGNVSLSFSGLASYEPGQQYSIDITVSDPGQLRFGFSMVARDADNDTTDVGTWSAGTPDTQVYAPQRTHVGHLGAPRLQTVTPSP